MTGTFAMLFRSARRATRDPVRGGHLTQERFAELVSSQIGRDCFPTSASVSNWERGAARPNSQDRIALYGIVTVLMQCGGLASLKEADALLIQGGYAPLTNEEVQRVSDYLLEAIGMREINEQQTNAKADHAHSGKQTVIAVRHQSMEHISARAIQPWLSQDLGDCQMVEIVVNQCDLFQGGRLTAPLVAAQRQHDLEYQIAAAIEEYPNAVLVYYGIAHIPLIFLAGYTLSNRREIHLFEFHRYTYTWDLLCRGGDIPPLRTTGIPEQVCWDQGEIAVRVSISFRVYAEDVREVIPMPIALVELGLDSPKLDAVTSLVQLQEYAQSFRQTLDTLHQCLPRATGLHIFYAGPPSLAFLLGQCISKTIHPQVVVYNYLGKDTPKYSWGFDLSEKIGVDTFLVRSSAWCSL